MTHDSVIRSFDVVHWTLGVPRFPAKLINVERAKFTPGTRARVRLAITKTPRAAQALVGRASHDVDDDRRHAAFDRSRVSDRNFLRLHPAVSAEDVAVDWRSVDFALQQDRCRDCGNAARCSDLGNAGDLRRGIPSRVLDPSASGGPTRAFSPVWFARLHALARIFASHLAHLLARLYWFALDRHPFSDIRLLSHAIAYHPNADAAEKPMINSVAAYS